MPVVSYFQIDAFADRAFAGNPAGVCPLASWLPDHVLLAMAAEHQLAETAFFVPKPEGGFHLRWFSPAVEVDLCGHATLATAHVLWRHLDYASDSITFHTRSGSLQVTRREDLLLLDFPSLPAEAVPLPDGLAEALGGGMPLWCGRSRDYLLVYPSEEDVLQLQPDFARLLAFDTFGFIVTAPGSGVDFVSRFFAPRIGISEDPATGSSHCTLIPYWARQLGKTSLSAAQLSARGGNFIGELRGDRVLIGGRAHTYLRGEITISDAAF